MTSSSKVLVLGSDERAALAVCRSLGKRGLAVHLVPMGGRCLAGSSKYVARSLSLGNPRVNVESFSSNLERRLSSESYSALIPLTDGACQICCAYREQLSQYTRIALPEASVFQYAHDKKKLLEKSRELGIPVPRYSTITRYAEVLPFRHSFPGRRFYLKPIHSSLIVNNRITAFRVGTACNFEELDEFVRFHAQVVPVMVQEECPGEGAGVYLLARNGKILSALQQNRLHEPSSGGGSSYRIAVSMSSDLLAYAEALVDAIGWDGVAMIEFKGDPAADRWTLMEVNGRFWGSLGLTVSAGLDFPYWLYELVSSGRSSSAKNGSAQVGVRQRHLARDLRWLSRQLRTSRNKVSLAVRWVRDLRYVLTGMEHFDVESWRDPLPSAAYVKYVLTKAFLRVKMHIWRRSLPIVFRLRRGQMVKLVKRVLREQERPNVLFVCRGNICRSPFAEQYCRQKLEYSSVLSAGMIPIPLRMVPRLAEDTAATDYGIDLRYHRSRVLGEEHLQWADVVAVMDWRDYSDVARMAHRDCPVIVLSCFGGSHEIPDPYHKTEDAYGRAYNLIAQSIERMLNGGWLGTSSC